jgi:hypothetical protein
LYNAKLDKHGNLLVWYEKHTDHTHQRNLWTDSLIIYLALLLDLPTNHTNSKFEQGVICCTLAVQHMGQYFVRLYTVTFNTVKKGVADGRSLWPTCSVDFINERDCMRTRTCFYVRACLTCTQFLWNHPFFAKSEEFKFKRLVTDEYSLSAGTRFCR